MHAADRARALQHAGRDNDVMTDPLPDTDLEQIEQRAQRALDAAPPPWLPFLETGGGLGGCSFIRVGDDPDVDQEMYLHVYTGSEQVTSPARLDPIIEFVGSAPDDVIRLIAEIRRLRRQPALYILIVRRPAGSL
jgi:hypothetical protein